MKKAVEKVHKHEMNGRPLKVKEDPDGLIAQREAHRAQGGGMGMGPGPGGPPMVIPQSLINNPNIPIQIIRGLQTGKIGSTVFVDNLDYKVCWKQLKELFCLAGVVVSAHILVDKDGKSRGMGTVTFKMPIEAVQAVSMFNGQLLFNQTMHVKLDERSLPKDFAPLEISSVFPCGLRGIGPGLGPGGQPIDAEELYRGGGGMGSMGPGGDMDRGFGFDHRGPAGFDRLGAGANARKGCQIFFRNIPLDVTWKMLKDAFSKCGMVQYAHIKRENGKSRGCGVVRFDNPETAERACRTMNGFLLNGQEISVWMDRYL